MGSDVTLWHALTQQAFLEDETYLIDDAKTVLKWLAAQKISFEGYSVLDIGCGSGALSIPILHQGANVTMLDLSQKMLHYVHDKNLGHHAMLWHDNWHTTKRHELYDIVIASMTPAIKHEDHIDKMIRFTRSLGIFVGWQHYCVNSFLDSILLAHDVAYVPSQESMDVKTFLKHLAKRSMAYNVHYFQTSWQRTFTCQEAKEYAQKQLLQRKIFPNQRKIDALCEDVQTEGKIYATSQAKKGVVLFSKCPLLKDISLLCS